MSGASDGSDTPQRNRNLRRTGMHKINSQLGRERASREAEHLITTYKKRLIHCVGLSLYSK